jgi:hypothetical protein
VVIWRKKFELSLQDRSIFLSISSKTPFGTQECENIGIGKTQKIYRNAYAKQRNLKYRKIA